jgi:predicted ArsR family transcriptional regulator
VLEFLESAPQASRVEDIAESVGLHPNTVRGHLDALLAAGRVTRSADLH